MLKKNDKKCVFQFCVADTGSGISLKQQEKHFTLLLQLGEADQLPQKQQKGIDDCVALLKGCKVLLVEDNQFNQDLAMVLLTRKGISVTTAGIGAEALAILQNMDFDRVLMDI